MLKTTNMNYINPPRMVSVLLVGLVWFSLWKPPVPYLPLIDWRWFILAGVGFAAFLLQGNRIFLNEASSTAVVIMTLIILGGLLGLFRSPQKQDVILYQTAGAIIGLGTHVLFIQILVYDKVRKLLIVSIVTAGAVWSMDIISRTLTLGDLARYTFTNVDERGGDKNFLALLLALVTVILIVLFLYWERPKTWDRLNYRIVRLFFMGIAVFAVFATSLTYSRSGLLIITLSSTIVIFIFMITQNRSRMEIILVVVVGVITFLTFFLDDYLEAYPFWTENVDRIIGEESYEFNRGRYDTMHKSLLLWQENPIIGTGAGTYRSIVVDLGDTEEVGATAHNTYLAISVETGILGSIALLMWLTMYVRMLFRHFKDFTLADKILIHSFIPLFLMMFFLDITGVMFFFITLFSALYFVYNSAQAKTYPQLAA